MQGADSWCYYNKAVAEGKSPKPPDSHDAINADFAYDLIDDFDALTDEDTLEKCSRNATQNANEALNGQIWRRCPKTVYVSSMVVSIATAMAVTAFNRGAVGVLRILHQLQLRQTANSITMTAAKDKQRLNAAANAEKTTTKKQESEKTSACASS